MPNPCQMHTALICHLCVHTNLPLLRFSVKYNCDTMSVIYLYNFLIGIHQTVIGEVTVSKAKLN